MAGVPPSSPSFPASALPLVEQGRIIEAIKIIREERGLGLKESKDLVDAYLANRPDLKRRLDAAQAESGRKAVRWLVFLLVLAAASAYVLSRTP